jgi:putative SOS response-associated peptidase YedK
MCGRFSLTQSAQTLARIFQLETVPDWLPRYNIAPTQSVATILQAEAEQQFRLLRWGLVPSWAKDLAIGTKLINARAETIAEKPSFRSAFKQRRCLVLADGFYEWKRMGVKKQPYYFQLQDGQPFAFAGLWEHWQGNGAAVESCTIITTQANAVVESVHDRMPVILAPQDYASWLSSTTPIEQLHNLLHPYSTNGMKGFAVNSVVNSPASDRPECIQPLEARD